MKIIGVGTALPQHFYDQETLLAMMQSAGFDRCRYQNLAGGIVALHIGYRI